jgi:Domain of unknown function (DUF4193)
MATTTDYDAPRRREADESTQDGLAELAPGLTTPQTAVIDGEDLNELAAGFELPGADLSGEELMVQVIPKQADEFTCTSCFLVYHRSRMARDAGMPICADCA